MKTLLPVLLFLLTIAACKKSPADRCSPEKKEYVFQAGKTIDAQRRMTADTNFEFYSYTFKEGNNNVFNFTWSYRDCPEVADDEGARIIIFEAPRNGNSFLIKDSANLRNAKTLINFACFCYPSSPVLVKGGYIQGTRQSDNRWHVKASLLLHPQNNDVIDFEADFVAK